jgi:hypothetical protein
MAQKWMINSMLVKITPSPYNLLPNITCPLAHPFYKEHKARVVVLCNVQLCFQKLSPTLNNTITIFLNFHGIKLAILHQTVVTPHK